MQHARLRHQRRDRFGSAVVERLSAMRGPHETYSDVILRLAALEAGARHALVADPMAFARMASPMALSSLP
jgi:hypothetical protein